MILIILGQGNISIDNFSGTLVSPLAYMTNFINVFTNTLTIFTYLFDSANILIKSSKLY